MSYRNLQIYQLAHTLAVNVHQMSLKLPKFEMYEEGQQIRRSSKSVSSNIVEGYCRRRYVLDYIRFIVSAHGSCEETIEHLEFLSETGSLKNEEFISFLKKHRCFSRQRMDYLRRALEQKSPVDETLILCKKRLMRAIVSQLRVVFSQIKEYDNLLNELLAEHEDYQWVQSLPGAGTVISSKIISHFGDNRSHFSEYKDVQALAGTAPVTVASGKYRNVHFRFSCSKPFRDTMQMLAFCSLRESQWAKAYYRRKRDEGKNHSHAIRCLAHIWLKIVYSLWQKRCLYSEQKHLASIGKHALHNA